MKKSFFKCLLLIISVITIANCNLLAQNTPGLVADKTNENQINSGIVIAFGETINSPYFVEMSNGTVLINGIQFFPRLSDPTTIKHETIVSDFTIQKHEAIQEIGKAYKHNLGSMNDRTAVSTLISDFQNGNISKTTIISSIDQKDHSLVISFSDDSREVILLDSYKMDYSEKENDQEAVVQQYEKIIDLLQKDWTIVFDYKKTEFITPKSK